MEMVVAGCSAELLSGAVGAIGWLWVSVADGWLGCAVVVVSGSERPVGHVVVEIFDTVGGDGRGVGVLSGDCGCHGWCSWLVT